MAVITLESLLIKNEETQIEAVAIDPAEAALECADVYAELADIEANITNYEAAKIIKKGKSNKKKVKVATSKMKASEAKAKKAGGKVVKIKKVTKEGDAELDGGTGPLPTTTDTNGLTDTDLDADPDADVEVTEVIDDGTPQEEIVGTEGADFMVEYEDAYILTLEDEQQKQKVAFGEKLKALWDKIKQFIQSCIAKIVEFFNFDKKFVTKNQAAIEEGLKKGVEVPGKAAETVKTLSTFTNVTAVMGQLNGMFSAAIASDDGLTKLEEAVANIKSGIKDGKEAQKGLEKATVTASDIKVGDIVKFITDGKKPFNDAKGAAAKAGAEAVKAAGEDGEKRARAKKASGLFQRAVSASFSVYGQYRSAVMTVAKAAAKAGGAKVEDKGDGNAPATSTEEK